MPWGGVAKKRLDHSRQTDRQEPCSLYTRLILLLKFASFNYTVPQEGFSVSGAASHHSSTMEPWLIYQREKRDTIHERFVRQKLVCRQSLKDTL
jgi:hypothetical protein